MIKGITVKLHKRSKNGEDEFHQPIYTDDGSVDVENVLVSPVSADERISSLDLEGRHIVYELAIPKGDNNKWEDQIVEFFGQEWHVYGIPVIGIEDMIPLQWNKKVTVERYE